MSIDWGFLGSPQMFRRSILCRAGRPTHVPVSESPAHRRRALTAVIALPRRNDSIIVIPN